MCEDKTFIPPKHQSYVVHWYHMYLPHPGMDRIEEMILQNLHWTGIRPDVWNEVSNFDTFQRTKRPNKKYARLPAKLSEEIPRKNICVGLIGTYTITINGKKENLHLKAVTMIYPVTGWFEITRYDD